MQNKSFLLEYIIECAEKMRIADGKNALSANYFIISLLQIIEAQECNQLPDNLKNDETIKELAGAKYILSQYKIDFRKLINEITAAIHDNDYKPFMDEFIFRKINHVASEAADKKAKKAIDVCDFIDAIISEPTNAIKKYILTFEAKKEETENKDTSIEDEVKKLVEEMQDMLGIDPDDEDNEDGNTEQEQKSLTGVQRLSQSVQEAQKIQKFLLQNVFGQDQAVNTFISGYFQAKLNSQIRKNNKKPQATFLFAGPPGVGKTFLAEMVAEALNLPYQRFDMSEYADKEANLEFCGSDKVYKNAKEGNVTGFVNENPQCVLLFDEIEKAHINVIHLFLQMLDAGRLRDNFTDDEVSFADAIIIFTTNVGKNLYDDPSIINLSAVPRKTVLKALSTDINPMTNAPMFPAAICSRFASGNVVMFNHLNADNLLTIVNKELNHNTVGFEESTGIKLNINPHIPSAIMLAEGGKADARTVKGRTNSFFHDELYELFRLISSTDKKNGVEKLKSIDINISLDGCDDNVSKLFNYSKKPEILIFAEPNVSKKCKSKLKDVTPFVTDDEEKAKNYLFNHDISIILCDIRCKERKNGNKLLNAEDIRSAGVSFLNYAVEKYDIPLFLLQQTEKDLTQEEYLSFAKIGVQGIIAIKTESEKSFEEQVLDKCMVAYRQSNMLELAKANKVLTYKSSQTLNRSRTAASINLFDFELMLSTDTEDSKSILDNASKPNVRFDDVIGAEDAKGELKYFVEYLKDPKKFMRKGLKAPKGVLLYGPPGTGKTLLAKAMASESDVTFLTAEGNQFLKKFVGEGADAVHAMFTSARKYAPAILFVDEIDAIAKNRSNPSTNDTNSDVLTAFLTEMDGFNTDKSKPVFVLAATNYDVEQGSARSLDPALLRRFDRRIYVDLPNKEERKQFIRMRVEKSSNISLSEEQIDNIAMRSTGMSLAELDSIFELAMRSSIRTNKDCVSDEAFEEAFETFNGGEVKKWSVNSLLRTARHEAGHALICWMSGEKPSYLTIVARGNHGGYMQHANNEDKGVYTKAELLSRIRTSLGGRACELVYYGKDDGISTGPSGDLHSATRIAEQMICNYGMDETVGMSYIDSYSGPLPQSIRDRVNEVLCDELKNALNIIENNKKAIDKLVDALMEKNHLKENEIDDIFNKTIKKTKK